MGSIYYTSTLKYVMLIFPVEAKSKTFVVEIHTVMDFVLTFTNVSR